MTKIRTNKIQIPDRLFFRIGDVADLLGVKPHVLRYWESEFSIISPQKSASGQRVYRRSDVETLVLIRHLLHEERYSIEGARKRIRELRKEGELRAYKQEKLIAQESPAPIAVTVESPKSEPSAPSVSELREKATAILALARKPMGEIFRLSH